MRDIHSIDKIDNKVKNLKCYVLPGHSRDCKLEHKELHNKAYQFWYDIMRSEMEKEGLTDIDRKLSSDAWMLFDDVFVLADEQDNVVGLFCFDTKDINSNAVLDQDYFKTYPKEILEQYVKPYDKIMTIGHLLVHPEWRRSKIGIGLSDILVWFMHKRFAESGSDLMLYWTRNNRSTDHLGKKHGGREVEKSTYGELEASIIATRPEDVVLETGNAYIDRLSQLLWDTRSVLKADKEVPDLSARVNIETTSEPTRPKFK